MVPDIPYIKVTPKCIMILSRSIGRMAWRRTSQNMWLCPNFSRLRQSILSLVVRLRLLRFRLGSGTPLIMVGHPRNRKQHYTIWIITDRFTKYAHIVPVKSTYKAEDYARLYIDEIVRWHGIPLSIIWYRGAQFTSHFWRSIQKSLGTHMKLSTAFNPQTDGQAERTIQTLEDMLRACVIYIRGS